MNPERYQEVKRVFFAALEATTASARASILAKATAADPSLRKEVESLLAQLVRSDLLLQQPILAAPPPPPPAPPVVEKPAAPAAPKREHSRRIEGYTIRRLIDESATSSVFLARHDESRRSVVLELVRPGAASERGLRRLELEADALMRLHDPGIAHVLEVRTEDLGHGPQPVFVTEFADELPLAEALQKRTLGPRQRLDLVATLCRAVHEAHLRGVVHRALNPTTVRVDERGQPRVFGFGVASLTDSDLRVAGSEAAFRPHRGVVPYLSPEQVVADGGEIDARADVYSLAVIGYELLTGRLPYEARGSTVAEAVRVICEDAPTPLGRVSRVPRRDVEAIFATALEKDRDRRYASASEMASDIERALRGEPISVRRKRTIPIIGALNRREKRNAALLAIGVVVIVVGAIAFVGRALRRSPESKPTTDFFAALLAAPSPSGQDSNLGELLDRAAADVEKTLAGDPLAQAAARHAIGAAYVRIGRPDAAEPELRAARETRVRVLGNEHVDTLATTHALADALRLRGSLVEAEELYRRVFDVRTRVLGKDHVDTLRTASGLAATLADAGKRADAETLLARTLDGLQRALGNDNAEVVRAGMRLAALSREAGKAADAERLYRQSVDSGRHVLGEQNPEVLAAAGALAAIVADSGRLTDAEALLRSTMESERRVLGDDNSETITTTLALASVVQREEKFADAEVLYRQVLEVDRRARPGGIRGALDAMSQLAVILEAEGKSSEAESLCREALVRMGGATGDEFKDTLAARIAVGSCLGKLGRFEDAEVQLVQGFVGMKLTAGDKSPKVRPAVTALAELYEAWKKPEKAAEYRAMLALSAEHSPK
ncbi:MAG: serine/threonine protein kinase [Planctomycetes bacterium]|nr:serine/threonine protein kinase [Planctomycetota bacterium]MBI3848401.1 serine/threonine protein kinase [Planctomycetota bacterium]